jgi:hypothetical protein
VRLELLRGAMSSDFTPGVWRHFKGADYLALGLAREDETDEIVVVYVRLYAREGFPMSTRKLSVWNQTVEYNGYVVPRFSYIGQVQSVPPTAQT